LGVGFDEFRIPLLDFRELLLACGNRKSVEGVAAAICGPLTV
jgi:hypothetical protein